MTDREIVKWLLQNGGPSIRYRTATELLDDPDSVDLDRLAQDLLESPQVRVWLDRLLPDTSRTGLHHSRNTAYENAIGKLVQLGCKRGMPAFDQRTQPFRSWLEDELEKPSVPFGLFFQILVAAFLAMAGYCRNQAVRALLTRRLQTLYQFTRRRDYSIYAERDAYSGIPKAFRGKPLVNPELYANGDMQLPSIHDVNALAHFSWDLDHEHTENMIDTVIGYILSAEYQRLPDGYGIVRLGVRRYHAMGWDVKLPGYFGYDLGDWDARQLVQRVELMAHFPIARRHRWFQDSVEHLESHRTMQGTYLSPVAT